MLQSCARCRGTIKNASIEVTVRISGLAYATFVMGQTCGDCRKEKIDPSELAAYRIGVAMRHVASGRLTGRSHAFCRKSLRLDPGDYAKSLSISEECLLSFEDSEAFVAKEVFEAMSKHVRRYFKSLAFVPRLALDEETGMSARTPGA